MIKTENKIIYHFTKEVWWSKWKSLDTYETENLAQEGFIHCCTENQIELVYKNYFLNEKNILLLQIDISLLTSKLKYELSTDNQYFPHIYGPINKESIVAVSHLSEFLQDQN